MGAFRRKLIHSVASSFRRGIRFQSGVIVLMQAMVFLAWLVPLRGETPIGIGNHYAGAKDKSGDARSDAAVFHI